MNFNFSFLFIKTSKDLPAENYQKKKKKTMFVKGIIVFLRRRKTRCNNIVAERHKNIAENKN